MHDPSPRLPFVAFAALTLPLLLPAQAKPAEPAASPRRQLEAADYGAFETLGQCQLSPDGRFLSYQLRTVAGDGGLRLVELATREKESEETEIDYGFDEKFSADNRWLACLIGVSAKAREAAQKAKKPIRYQLGLRDLQKGSTTKIKGIQAFTFSEDGAHLVMQRYPLKGRKSKGKDILVRNLATGRDTSFGNVASYRFVDDGALLAMTLDVEGKIGNGVQVYDAKSGQLHTLDSEAARYSSLVWRKDAADLAVLREREHGKEEDESFVVLTWRGLDTPKPQARIYDHLEDRSFPAECRVVAHAGLRWSEDGETVFFGIKAWDNKPKALRKKLDALLTKQGSKPEAEPATDQNGAAAVAAAKPAKPAKSAKSLRESLDASAGVEVWHAKDIDILPRQKKTADRDRKKHFLAAFWLSSGNFVALGSELTEQVRLGGRQKLALGLDNTPHETLKRFGPTLNDLYMIEVESGARRQVLTAVKYSLGSSPEGRFWLYVRDNQLWTYDAQEDAHRDLTSGLPHSFINQEASQLTDEKRPYGLAGWSEDGRFVYLYDRYDLWQFRSDGSASQRLTSGREGQVRYRRVVLDRDEDKYLGSQRPIYLSTYGDRSKQAGYARLQLGKPVEPLFRRDKAVGQLTKAKDAEVYAYVEQGFDDSPDVFVAGPLLAGARQISKTNAQQKQFHWGRSELVDFTNKNGVDLQGALYYPADYQPGKRYPMIVYIYELRSQNLHRYPVPSERKAYNPAVFTSQGYFVFQPDIVYRAQNPGISAVECVVPAVKKVLATGMVHPEQVGLVGHSWGAYQTSFIVTQTDLFAAGVAGAPLTNMMSMSMSIYWNTGQTDAWIFHESQGRMDKPFWQDVETYIKNSPIFQIEQLKTPLLIAFGDKDGAVDWHQGIEMYNAARLAQKPLVMLVYAGENHGLRKKPNQVDYHYRVRHWFDHHLKGAPAQDWVVKGTSFLERERQLKTEKKQREQRSKKKDSAKKPEQDQAGKQEK